MSGSKSGGESGSKVGGSGAVRVWNGACAIAGTDEALAQMAQTAATLAPLHVTLASPPPPSLPY
jgi:hypothetical protein